MKTKTYILTLLTLFTLPIFAQYADDEEYYDEPVKVRRVQRVEKYRLMNIKGKVYDEASKSPLGGIQLQMLGNQNYTAMSDDDGSFVIRVPIFATSLYVYSPEYLSQQVAIGDSTKEVVIYMLSDKFSQMYDKDTHITASRSITSEKPGYLTIDNEIENRLGADVHSIARSYTPGIGNTMFIRGINSLNANAQPLVIVDGVELDLQLYGTNLHDGQFNNLLATVSPADIDKVTVLKNATALYGSRGSNGVIIIDTKRGHSMATRIDADISLGFTLMPTLPKMMNAEQYRLYATEMLSTIEGTDNISFNFLNDDPTGYYYQTYHNDTNWGKEVYRTALTQNYGINVQGGDNVGMYNLSLGFANVDSPVKESDWNRMNVRFNTDITIWNNLSTKFNLAISQVTRNLFDDGASDDIYSTTPTSPTFLGLIKSPLVSPYQYNATVGGFTSLLSPADEIYDKLGSSYSLANPIGILQEASGENRNYAENTNFSILFEPTLKIARGLEISSLFNYSLNRNTQRYTRPATYVPGYELSGLATVYLGYASFFSSQTNVLSNTHLDYSHTFGAHTLSVYAGFRYNYFSYDSDYLNTDYTSSSMENKNPTHPGTLSYNGNYYFTVDGEDNVWKQMQWYANVDYNYRNRYFLTASLTAEANSRFGANCGGLSFCGVNWALFPSVQLGWVVSNEKWFSKNIGVDYLKLNVGYDISGNDGIDNYAAQTLYTTVKYLYEAIGIQLTNIGNDKIKWESTHKFNAGLQANFLHNRLSFAVDYFISRTTDLLTLKTFDSPIGGINNYWTNEGELRNMGFEAMLSFKPLAVKNWTIEIGASVGHYKNKVISLPNGDYLSSIYGEDNILTAVGGPVAQFYGYKTLGVLSDDAEAKAAGKDGYLYFLDDTGAKQYFKAGDIHFSDLNDDGIIDDNDKMVIGDPNPDIYGNIFATINWKNFTLGINFNYSLGNDVYNYQRMLLNSGSTLYNQQVAETSHWRSEGQITDIPKLAYGDPMGNNRMSDRWIEDGSYLRLKTLMLSYKVPVHWSWLQGLTISVEAINLLTFTKYLGSDPEFSIGQSVMYQGIDCGNLAQSRAFTLGLKINL